MINRKNPYMAQQAEREAEQGALETEIMASPTPAATQQDLEPAGKIKRTVLSLSITEEDKRLLQTYSIQHGQTAAATVHQWIQQHCK